MSISKLYIKDTKKTPEINFDQRNGQLVLKGKSIPENATKTYEPAISWLKEYIKSPKQETNLHFDLMYFNTASSIWMARMIRILSKINDREKLLVINLYFDMEEFDEMEEQDMQDAIAPVLDVVHEATVSLGVKIFGTDHTGARLKQKLILI